MLRPETLTDESLIALYESLRRQIAAASASGARSRVCGDNTLVYVNKVCAELERRQLQFAPIDWMRTKAAGRLP
jgi:hypothetical protein